MPRLFALYAAAAAAVLFGAIGIALYATWLPRWASAAPPADAPAPQVALTVHDLRRCPHCGWIEAKREIVPGVANPQSPKIYEYTLRMADGTSTLFQEALPVSWRVGERLAVIDGKDPSLK